MKKFSSALPLRPGEGTRQAIAQIERDANTQMHAPASGYRVKSKCKDKGTKIDRKWK